MAVAVPVATKLVQESQDTRNQAAGCTSSVIGKCGTAGGCSTGYRCIYSGSAFTCSYDSACGSFTPTNTPKPPTAAPNPCSVISNKPNNCACTSSSQCSSGYCSGVCKTKPAATATPTKKLTATPTLAGNCGQPYNRNNGCACKVAAQCISQSCISGKCVPKPTPTSTRRLTPIPTSRCLMGLRYCSSDKKGVYMCADNGLKYIYLDCANGWICNNLVGKCIRISPTPIKQP